ncbi:MAG TPA: LuxR family transcriptional regulator [Phycisphaerae bacterium]|nr:LuxR family transcriptional regulator [Phycisphaerae bacterium]
MPILRVCGFAVISIQADHAQTESRMMSDKWLKISDRQENTAQMSSVAILDPHPGEADKALLIEDIVDQKLRDRKIAVLEVFDGLRQEKADMVRQILVNVDHIIMPLLDELDREIGLSSLGRKKVSMLRSRLRDITSPFAGRLMRRFTSLTPSEVRICDLIRQGMSSKEVASEEHISPATIRTYRYQIRRKLDLLNKRVNLASYLRTMMSED